MTRMNKMEGVNSKQFTLYYVVALAIIASLSIVSHVLLDLALKRNEGYAYIINISGRQRMYSQRIARFALEYVQGNMAAKQEMTKLTQAFKDAHEELLRIGHVSRTGNENSQKLYNLYYNGKSAINRLVKQVANDVAVINKQESQSHKAQQALQDLLYVTKTTLLIQLDQAVSIYQHESERRLHLLSTVQWVILATILFTLLLEAIFLFRPMIMRIVLFTEKLFDLATVDTLTDLKSRGYFLSQLALEVKRMKRNHRNALLLMLTIDNFKVINDNYGRRADEAVLLDVSKILRNNARAGDVIARISDEEFAILVSDGSLEAATNLAERIRRSAEVSLVKFEAHEIHYTLSIGVAEMLEGDYTHSLGHADEAMYQAKKDRGNKVCIYTKE